MNFLVLIIGCLFIISSRGTTSVYGSNASTNICDTAFTDLVIPRDGELENEAQFNYLGSALQVFPHLKAECDGYISQWHFISRSHFVFGLHLLAIRRIGDTFHLVGDDYLRGFAINESSKESHVFYKSPSPIKVEKGDIIGNLPLLFKQTPP